MGRFRCSSLLTNFLSGALVGGSRRVALRTTLACSLVGGLLGEQGPLHVLAGGGGGMVVCGAHHDEDLPFVEKDVVPPLRLGLRQGRSRPNVHGVLGGEGHKAGEVAAPFPSVGRGEDMGGGGGVRVGRLITVSTQNTMMGLGGLG